MHSSYVNKSNRKHFETCYLTENRNRIEMYRRKSLFWTLLESRLNPMSTIDASTYDATQLDASTQSRVVNNPREGNDTHKLNMHLNLLTKLNLSCIFAVLRFCLIIRLVFDLNSYSYSPKLINSIFKIIFVFWGKKVYIRILFVIM